MSSYLSFDYPANLTTPYGSTIVRASAPPLLATAFNVSGVAYNATLTPKLVEIPVSAAGSTTTLAISVPTTLYSLASSSGPSPNPTDLSNGGSGGSSGGASPVTAALGAVLGVVLAIAAGLILWLSLRNKRLRRALVLADQRDMTNGQEFGGNYQLYAKENIISQEDSPAELKRQLAAVRLELGQANAFIPSTIRDESDYQRDLAILNDHIRQVSMQMSRASSGASPASIRAAICGAIAAEITSKFDPVFENNVDSDFLAVQRSLNNSRTADLWKAMTVKSMPLADAREVGIKVQGRLDGMIGSTAAWSGQIVEALRLAIGLTRAMAEDGKGYVLSQDRDWQYLALVRTGYES